MITVLAYWLLLFLIFLPGGLLVNKIFRLHTKNVPLLLFAGMLFTTLVFSITAFFNPLDTVTFFSYLAFVILLSICFWKDYKDLFKGFRREIASLPLLQKSVFVILVLGAALKSAQIPTIIDNESYYLQTIKWVNEYGFVKGLGNLHPFLAQMSPWHVLQAGLNLNFVSDKINDLNGFVFIAAMAFCFMECKKQESGISWITLIPFFSVLYFFFLDSPSPDLTLVIITPIFFYLLAKQHIAIPWMLLLFMAFIKITIAPLALLFLYPLFRTRKLLPGMALSGLAISILWAAKNYVISGYPLYPLTFLDTGTDWQIPKHLLDGLNESSNADIYGVKVSASWIEKFISWLTIGGIDGVFNIVIISLFIMMSFFKRIRRNNLYRIIYIGCLIHFITLFFISPQFRFFLPEIIFFLAFITAEVLNALKLRLYEVCLIACTALVFVTIPNFNTGQLYQPEAITANPQMQFTKKHEGNLNYYSPKENFFFYGTADGPLPCVNKVQLERFRHKYGVMPQIRGQSLQDGFYSMPVANE